MATTTPAGAPRIHTPASVIWTIIAVSAAASAFIFWLVYFHQPVDMAGTQLAFLPALNGLLNGLSAICILIGVRFIMAKKVKQHRTMIFTAFFFSTLFLVSYLGNFALHGETKLPIAHTGGLWWTYLLLLISHILTSVVALPIVLITFFLSLTERFPQHRALAKYTYPLWMYVSVTGVVVYLMQAAIRR